MRKFLGCLSLAAVLLSSCSNSNTNTPSTASNDGTSKKNMEQTNGNYKNGIRIKENGLRVERAILLKADNSPLEEHNTVGIGEKIYCRLHISGWKEENGRVKLGASEKIMTSSGDVVKNEDDLFSSMTDASAQDATVVTLSAEITNLSKSIHDFEVKFRVWDKVSNDDVTGSFEFHLN